MQNIRFDDGYREFMLNDDPDKVIRFDPTDFAIINRFNEALKNIEKSTEGLEDIELDAKGDPQKAMDDSAEIVSSITKYIKEQVDYMFDSPVSDKVFGNKSPLATVKGKPLFERFLEAAIPMIEKEIRKEMKASEKRVSKYTSQVK